MDKKFVFARVIKSLPAQMQYRRSKDILVPMEENISPSKAHQRQSLDQFYSPAYKSQQKWKYYNLSHYKEGDISIIFPFVEQGYDVESQKDLYQKYIPDLFPQRELSSQLFKYHVSQLSHGAQILISNQEVISRTLSYLKQIDISKVDVVDINDEIVNTEAALNWHLDLNGLSDWKSKLRFNTSRVEEHLNSTDAKYDIVEIQQRSGGDISYFFDLGSKLTNGALVSYNAKDFGVSSLKKKLTYGHQYTEDLFNKEQEVRYLQNSIQQILQGQGQYSHPVYYIILKQVLQLYFQVFTGTDIDEKNSATLFCEYCQFSTETNPIKNNCQCPFCENRLHLNYMGEGNKSQINEKYLQNLKNIVHQSLFDRIIPNQIKYDRSAQKKYDLHSMSLRFGCNNLPPGIFMGSLQALNYSVNLSPYDYFNASTNAPHDVILQLFSTWARDNQKFGSERPKYVDEEKLKQLLGKYDNPLQLVEKGSLIDQSGLISTSDWTKMPVALPRNLYLKSYQNQLEY